MTMHKGIGRGAAALLWALMVAGSPSFADEGLVQDDAQNLAELIDRRIESRWEDDDITPAPPADDAEYLRRVYLHVGGTIPSAWEVREFLADDAPDKRRRVVEKLLERTEYVAHFTNYWRGVLLPEAEGDQQARFLTPGFEAWLRERLRENTPYDEMVRQILTEPLESEQAGRGPYARLQTATPQGFFRTKQLAPENIAAAASRIFLGVRIGCAQCHDHPFDKWEQEQFWSFAAFFGGIVRQNEGGVFSTVREIDDRRELAIPGTDRVVQAAYLDGSEPQWRPGENSRERLAAWITARENPYFAKAAVNRMWGHFFGRGLVDPIDDFGAYNPPSHPQLLDELTAALVEHDYDLKFLIRAITASRTYQRTSRQTHASQSDPSRFARMAVQGLTAEQLGGALSQATGDYQRFQPRRAAVIGGNDPRSDLLQTFSDDSESTTERQRTILQALAMMNGPLIAEATSLKESKTLAAVAHSPFLDTGEKIEALYLAALSRTPTSEERERMLAYVEGGGSHDAPQQALADVFWVLLNSSEFMVNH